MPQTHANILIALSMRPFEASAWPIHTLSVRVLEVEINFVAVANKWPVDTANGIQFTLGRGEAACLKDSILQLFLCACVPSMPRSFGFGEGRGMVMLGVPSCAKVMEAWDRAVATMKKAGQLLWALSFQKSMQSFERCCRHLWRGNLWTVDRAKQRGSLCQKLGCRIMEIKRNAKPRSHPHHLSSDWFLGPPFTVLLSQGLCQHHSHPVIVSTSKPDRFASGTGLLHKPLEFQFFHLFADCALCSW